MNNRLCVRTLFFSITPSQVFFHWLTSKQTNFPLPGSRRRRDNKPRCQCLEIHRASQFATRNFGGAEGELLSQEAQGAAIKVIPILFRAISATANLLSKLSSTHASKWELGLELSFLAVHVYDRSLHSLLTPEKRAEFMDTIVHGLAEMQAEIIDPPPTNRIQGALS